jgi:hypothetical protein
MCGESRFANLDLKAVVLIRMISRGRIKGESVKGGCVYHTARNRARDVIARVEHLAAALSCEHLQPSSLEREDNAAALRSQHVRRSAGGSGAGAGCFLATAGDRRNQLNHGRSPGGEQPRDYR